MRTVGLVIDSPQSNVMQLPQTLGGSLSRCTGTSDPRYLLLFLPQVLETVPYRTNLVPLLVSLVQDESPARTNGELSLSPF